MTRPVFFVGYGLAFVGGFLVAFAWGRPVWLAIVVGAIAAAVWSFIGIADEMRRRNGKR